MSALARLSALGLPAELGPAIRGVLAPWWSGSWSRSGSWSGSGSGSWSGSWSGSRSRSGSESRSGSRSGSGSRWNGAWSAFQAGRPFDEKAFAIALEKMGAGADWTVVPDIVAGGRASLALSLAWLPRVLDATPLALIAVQDGMVAADVEALLGPRVGIFVGGGTAWKLGTMPAWGALARERGCWLHVGRVNSGRRIRDCHAAGATSFDGTSASKYSVTCRRLDLARRQPPLKY